MNATEREARVQRKLLSDELHLEESRSHAVSESFTIASRKACIPPTVISVGFCSFPPTDFLWQEINAMSQIAGVGYRALAAEVGSLERKLAYARRAVVSRRESGPPAGRRSCGQEIVRAPKTKVSELQMQIEQEEMLRKEAEQVLAAVVARLQEAEGKERRLLQAAQSAKDEQVWWRASALAAWNAAEKESRVANAHQLARLGEQVNCASHLANNGSPVRRACELP